MYMLCCTHGDDDTTCPVAVPHCLVPNRLPSDATIVVEHSTSRATMPPKKPAQRQAAETKVKAAKKAAAKKIKRERTVYRVVC